MKNQLLSCALLSLTFAPNKMLEKRMSISKKSLSSVFGIKRQAPHRNHLWQEELNEDAGNNAVARKNLVDAPDKRAI